MLLIPFYFRRSNIFRWLKLRNVNMVCRDVPLAEAVRCQIEVQKTLQEQLEVNVFKKHNNSSLHLYLIIGKFLFRQTGAEEIANENRSTREVLASHIRKSSTEPFC